ncbi:UTP--glucose-1-phosphate uridylyltransferase GalU [Gulosibacter molinativorax]|uniref:UTP--glucose-1-phosphate uridylyltransferase n=1 Tax=Gulosibacter molinativorax TaxID=256821 RepID=A0ABT7C8C1_9MICO|nr:UTP--glucose-1-phosphate uridylyltransferase GalU [Gulosibacter molinativorax]MDJ1371471.1 UTP--glucose-1-phosphate uridylyltransferase [Gulosibacter molinativorax]QUY62411.1 UTP--glucose-1-phosphate uridylyltransferase [Gulosibacter molinativorax]
MTSQVTKAVIPAAGLGTRFLPATKAMPKEMLPVVDRPAIQYVVEEAVQANLRDVLMVTGRNKTPLENHFDRVPSLETALKQRGDDARLQAVRRTSDLADVHYLRQGDPLGLGHAVLRAKQHVGDNSFAVLLGDDIIDDEGELLREMLAIHAQTGASVIAVQEVPEEQVSSYGVVDPSKVDGELEKFGDSEERPALWVDALVEKPAFEQAPSNLAIIGRYVLRPEVFEVLERTAPGRGGEIQLTDALQELAARREELGGVIAVVFRGRRYDTGNKLDYLKANVELGVAHPEIGEQVSEWILEYAKTLTKDQ